MLFFLPHKSMMPITQECAFACWLRNYKRGNEKDHAMHELNGNISHKWSQFKWIFLKKNYKCPALFKFWVFIWRTYSFVKYAIWMQEVYAKIQSKRNLEWKLMLAENTLWGEEKKKLADPTSPHKIAILIRKRVFISYYQTFDIILWDCS